MLHDPEDKGLFPVLDAEQLENCKAAGEIVHIPAGGYLFRDDDAEYPLHVLLSGRIRVFRTVQGEDVVLAFHGPGQFSGELSMLTGARPNANGLALEDTTAIRITPAEFRRLIAEHSPTGDLIITAMARRSQHMDRVFSQAEKLAALGKMSAALAHELNNPAAAAKRAATLMIEAVLETPFRMMKTDPRFSEEERQKIHDFAACMYRRTLDPQQIDPLERSDREQEVLDWLESENVPRADDIAIVFAGNGITVNDLDEWRKRLGDLLLRGIFWAETVIKLSELARDIESSTGRIAELVGAMKEYVYLDQAKFQEVDVHKGLESTLKILHHKWKNGIQIRREYNQSLPKICAYAGELNQVWTNLIDNAIDAMGTSGILTLRTALEGECVLVQICDNGSGIPPDVMKHIFEPFYTTKGVGKGTGLGLDIAYRIITNRHGGNIRVQSQPGGTCFSVSLHKNPPRERLK